MNFFKKYIPYVLTGWGSLGFYRGIMDYEYSVCKYEHKHIYTTQLIYGFGGTVCYLNPWFLFISIPKELYRLEVNIRGLEQEKYTDKYNELF
jgi:hypothetical protein